jgi:hypothetical protein
MFVDTACNPSFFSGVNTTITIETNGVGIGVDWKSILSLVIFLCCVLYARYWMIYVVVFVIRGVTDAICSFQLE